MKLKTTLFGNVYQFKDVKEVLAKANELRSGDVLAGWRRRVRSSAWPPSRCSPI
jgi:ethanolamine ammonia-lyase large subunit